VKKQQKQKKTASQYTCHYVVTCDNTDTSFKIRLKTSLIRHNRTIARASVLWRDIN